MSFPTHIFRQKRRKYLNHLRISIYPPGMEIYSTTLWHLQNEVSLSALAQELVETDRTSPQVRIFFKLALECEQLTHFILLMYVLNRMMWLYECLFFLLRLGALPAIALVFKKNMILPSSFSSAPFRSTQLLLTLTRCWDTSTFSRKNLIEPCRVSARPSGQIRGTIMHGKLVAQLV